MKVYVLEAYYEIYLDEGRWKVVGVFSSIDSATRTGNDLMNQSTDYLEYLVTEFEVDHS